MKSEIAAETETSLYLSPHAERLSELGSFEWNIRTNEVKWSDGLFRIYGLEPQQFGATLEAFLERVVQEDRAKVQAVVQHAIESCGSFFCVERILHTSGEIRYLESKGEVITNSHGEPVKLIGICRDVSALKKLEFQLRNSQKMEAVGRLAAGVAHDFNNLLTVVNMNAELLLSQSDSHADQQFALAIQDAGRRASKLTSQLLMFGRKGAAHQQIINLNHHISNSQNLLSSLLGDRVTLSTDFVDDLSNIKIDPTHLDQVLVNLAVNAQEAMPDGGVFTIRTTIEYISEFSVESSEICTGDYVALLISDTGIGMTKTECEKAFEPFYSDKPKGTGLGLAVVYGVVKDCSGLVQLTSEPGQGTTFRLLFPVVNEESILKETPRNSSDRKMDGERILFVDDEPLVRKVAHYTLEKNGYRVLSAESGEEAIELVKSVNGEIDLLLSDVLMPGMTGPELAEIVLGNYPDVAVLYTSGYNDSLIGTIDQQKLLPKPFSIQQLLSRVKKALS